MGYDDRMAKGLVRYQQAEDLHFLTFSCYCRQPYLDTKGARETFGTLGTDGMFPL